MHLGLKNREWKEFEIGALFDIKIGKNLDGNKINKTHGKTAYITRKETANGLDGFVDADNEYRNTYYPVITIGNETAKPFVQTFSFYTGTKVNILKPKEGCSTDSLKFISQCLEMQKKKYSYSFTINSTRLSKQKILLPVTAKGQPDYAFMEAYMRQKEQEKLKAYQAYITKRLEQLGGGNPVAPLGQVQWREFELGKLFYIKAGKRLTKHDMKKGSKPFIGATDNNNGITAYISNSNISEDTNILGVNYNGSVVENFYHPYTAIFSDDVKRLSFKETEGNQYLYLFAKNQILKQKDKFQYGYKFNATRMSKQKIMLPITSEGQPDYTYMEHYTKQLERQKLLAYCQHKGFEAAS